MMHGPEKSDLAIVAGKPAYKAEQSAAESVERRAGTKGNANQQSTCRTQSRISVSQALERIRPAFASDSVIHPRSPTGRALSDADSASSSTALSLRASGGVDVPGANAALMVFHIPMAGRYVAALQGTPQRRWARWIVTKEKTNGMQRVARGQPIVSSQERTRTHRLCQSPSG